MADLSNATQEELATFSVDQDELTNDVNFGDGVRILQAKTNAFTELALAGESGESFHRGLQLIGEIHFLVDSIAHAMVYAPDDERVQG